MSDRLLHRNDYRVIGLVSFAHAVSHFVQLIVPPLFPLIRDDLGVGYTTLGVLFATFYASSALFQPVAGFVVDRTNAVWVLAGGTLLMTIGLAIGAVSGSYPGLLIGSAIAGVGNSVFHPADYAILNNRVANNRLGYAYSIHGVLGYVGFAVAPAFSVTVGSAFGWSTALLVGSAIGLMTLVLLCSAARILGTKGNAARSYSLLTSDARILLTPSVVMCFAFFTAYASASAGLQGVGVPLLILHFGAPATVASAVLTTFLVAAACGMLLGGVIAAHSDRHRLIATAGLVAGAAAVLALAFHTVPMSAVPLVFGYAGLAFGVVAPSRDLIVRKATPAGADGRVYGFVYAGLDIGFLLMPVLYGWMLDKHLSQAVLCTVAGFVVLAILMMFIVPQKQPSPISSRPPS